MFINIVLSFFLDHTKRSPWGGYDTVYPAVTTGTNAPVIPYTQQQPISTPSIPGMSHCSCEYLLLKL